MLVLNRRISEKTYIDVDDVRIVLQVCFIKGKQVKLGFIAPKHVKITRASLVDEVPERGNEK